MVLWSQRGIPTMTMILLHMWHNFDKPFYQDWSFWLSAVSLFFLIVTISETTRLRKETQRQNKLNRQPYLTFGTNRETGNYIIFNASPNMAFNIFVLLRNKEKYKILIDGYVIVVMPIGKELEIQKGNLINCDKASLLEKIPSIKKLVKYLENKNENYQCIIYSDIFGNKMYSFFHVSSPHLAYDEISEIGYIDDINLK